MRSDDEALFTAFSQRIRQFQDFRRELVRRGIEINPAAGREWGDNDANRSVRKALNADLTRLGELYAKRSQRIYREIDEGIDGTAWLIGIIAIIAIVLAAAGAVIIWRAVARPLARITRITQAVAAGNVERIVPYGERSDEVGALARSIEVFQHTMRRNEELNRTVRDDARSRARRQEEMALEIAPLRRRGRSDAVRARAHIRPDARCLRPSQRGGGQCLDADQRARHRRRPRRPPTCATSRPRPTSWPRR